MNGLKIEKIIVDELTEFEGHLECNSCHHTEDLTPEDIGKYMKTGWPKHCGYTMTWITKNQELQNAKQDIKS